MMPEITEERPKSGVSLNETFTLLNNYSSNWSIFSQHSQMMFEWKSFDVQRPSGNILKTSFSNDLKMGWMFNMQVIGVIFIEPFHRQIHLVPHWLWQVAPKV